MRLLLTAGQRDDSTQAAALLEGFQPGAVIGDKAYDSDAFVGAVRSSGAEVVIPSKRHRRQQRTIDKDKYKDRNCIERFFGRIKHYRRVATRYDKTDTCFLAFVYLAAALTNAK
ncbi:hypothetical protein GCM10023184_33720 [Flaviaesturariibacter amylovorans]|uniref:Transposase DDE domain-containing protein n=1 Tax=Flaviaesturariibacter amylovorans TaxID=1084520 RepID=A0ABP8HDE3_9BACT